MCSFEAPGLLSGVLGVVFTALMARYGLGLSDDVPCVAARRLRELEAAAGPAPLAPSAEAVPTGSPKPRTGSRPVIELTAVMAAAADSDPPGSYLRQPRAARGEWQQQQQQLSGDTADPASGLLAALAAMSPVKATALASAAARPESAPAALLELGEEVDDEGAGERAGCLLGTREVRSHHDLAAYPGERRALAAAGGSRQPMAASPLLHGAAAAGGGSSVHGDPYLSDRRELCERLAPWLAMLLVVAGTRVPYLQKTNGHELRLHLRSLGDFYISSNLVVQFRDLCRCEAGGGSEAAAGGRGEGRCVHHGRALPGGRQRLRRPLQLAARYSISRC